MTATDPRGISGRGSRLRLSYVLGTYPVPTTTFIDREILQLRRIGVDVRPISIRRPERDLSPQQRAIQAQVLYVLPVSPSALAWSHLNFLLSRPTVYLRTLGELFARPHPDLRSRMRTVIHFGLGVHIARLIRDRCPSDHIHAHFVDRAALVALVAGRLLDRPFSATAHASDIYVSPVLLAEKMAGAKFIATCTRYNESYLLAVPGAGSRRAVRCIYHGLDLSDFHPKPIATNANPLVLSIGQLKEKKGFRYLIEAIRLLDDRGLAVDCEIVGDGPLRAELEARLGELRLADRVRLVGALSHDAAIEKYAEAGIFVLPSVTAHNGDRDGIPNVILEAMAMGLPVVSTRQSGIPEAVEDGRTGLLVPPRDAPALADALAALLLDGDLRARFGVAGRERAVETFDIEVNVQRLLEEFVA
jgi:colanic acid/amylovoran biosynthesis glycosyltransferase